MVTVSLAIPAPIVEFIDSRVSFLGYDSQSDYVLDLVRRDQREQSARQAPRPEAEYKSSNQTVDGYKRATALADAPRPREPFLAAARRLGLTESDLRSQERRYKAMHLCLYLTSGALLVGALWLELNVSGAWGAWAVLCSCGLAVQGYLAGFRAWQIQHRMFIRLQDAVRIRDTYLVI